MHDVEHHEDPACDMLACAPAPVFERDAHAPLPRSGMTLITETGEVLRVERVPDDAIEDYLRSRQWVEDEWAVEVAAVRATGWIIVLVQP